jgi:shikimate kinase
VSNLLQGVNLYLIGMMGAGKTTIGSLLAQQLNYKFVDTDTLIEKVAGDKPITQIFAEEGEATFRQLESKVLGEVCAFKNLVISTGGGIILKRENWSYLQHGLVAWLNVPVEVLYNRLAEDSTRPLLQDPDPKGKLVQLLEQRQALYNQADIAIRVSEGETPEQLATRIIEAIPSILKKSTSLPNTFN